MTANEERAEAAQSRRKARMTPAAWQVVQDAVEQICKHQRIPAPSEMPPYSEWQNEHFRASEFHSAAVWAATCRYRTGMTADVLSFRSWKDTKRLFYQVWEFESLDQDVIEYEHEGDLVRLDVRSMLGVEDPVERIVALQEALERSPHKMVLVDLALGKTKREVQETHGITYREVNAIQCEFVVELQASA
jgi:hypothetical protein